MRSLNPRTRGPGTVRPRARRGLAPEVQTLEGRRLLSTARADPFAPSDAAQYMLELINRARANPAAEGQRLLALVRSDPVLQQATQGWDLNRFLKTINSFGPEPPLAFNTRLNEAALDHDAAMLAANAQVHSPGGYLNNAQVARADDGQAFYPTGNNAWSTGENIFAYSGVADGNDVTAAIDYFEAGFLLDWGNPDFGHLTNVLAPGPGQWSASTPHYPYSEIGIGLLTNVSPTSAPGANPIAANNGLTVGPDIVTQEFGWRSGNPILTGTFYVDKAGTGFYAPGEGLGGVTVTAVGRQGQGTFRTQTWSSGGYSLALPPGSYDLTASGGPYALGKAVTLGTDNVSWGNAFKPGSTTPPPAPVTSPPLPTPAPTSRPSPPTTQTQPRSPKRTPPPPPPRPAPRGAPRVPVAPPSPLTRLQTWSTSLTWKGFRLR